MANRVPRPVPFGALRRSDPVITYSDGGGGDAGVGVVIFGAPPDISQPRPVYLQIPAELRELWSLQKSRSRTGATIDIFEIEAIGPLIALLEWPQLLANRPWVHFTANAGAQQALIRGSSNSLNGDVIGGETWNYARRIGCWLWWKELLLLPTP